MKPVQHLRIPTAKATETAKAGGRTASFTERLARSSATHPWRTMGIWVTIIVVAVLSMSALPGNGLTSESKQHGRQPDSTIGLKLIQGRMTGAQKMSELVIVRSATHTAEDAAYKAYVTELAGEIAALGDGIVESVATSYQTKDLSLVSKDGHAMLIQVVMAGDLNAAIDNVDELHAVVTAGQGGGFTLQQTGTASLNRMGNELAKSDMERAEVFGLPAALVVLVVVFGALLAAFMPLVLSILSIILALALTALIGQLYPMNTFVLNTLTTMGLAVGIDYTLFIISRYREERARGLEKIDAIAATGASASRAVFFSGMTVVLAMLGMVVVPMDLTISMGIGAMLVVFTTLLTSLILLPSLMGLLGDRVNDGREFLIDRGQLTKDGSLNDVDADYAARIFADPDKFLAAVESFNSGAAQ
jgi:RND superfamily putative drug exporter